MTSVDVLVPVLNRPANVRPLIDSLGASVRGVRVRAQLVFLVSPYDDEELRAVAWARAKGVSMPFLQGPGDYARKINFGARASKADWLFLAADDLDFHSGWLEACLQTHRETGALVIGTNDLGNPLVKRGKHSTHSLVKRTYFEVGTVDRPGQLLHEGYEHNCSDVELVETAMARGVWAFARESFVEHLHPDWGKAESDQTYLIGKTSHSKDMQLLHQRRRLWQPELNRRARIHAIR